MLKIFNAESKSVTGAALIIAGASLISRVVGLARDRVFAHYFGTLPTMDAYYAAFKIPDLIYNLIIVGALTAGFIPTFTKLFYRQGDKNPAWKLANNVINIICIGLLILCGLAIVFTPALTRMIAPGFKGEAAGLIIVFTRIMMLSPLLLGISMVMGGILQSLRQFLIYSLAPIFYNLGIIIGAVFLVKTPLGINGLAWGVVLGALLHAALQIRGAYANGYRWRWTLNFKDRDTILIGKLMLPRTLGLAVSQFNLVVVTILASLLPAGSVAVYNYANNLQGLPVGLIGIPFALAVFPFLSTLAANNDLGTFKKQISSTARQILFLIIPCSIALLLLRAQIVRIILGSGIFSWDDTINTANALAFFSLGLFGQALISLFARAFYAFSDTKTPVIIGLLSELISIIAALLLMKPLGVAGLGLAVSIGAIFNAVVLYFTLRKKTNGLDDEKIVSSIFKISVAGIFMAITIQILKYPISLLVDMEKFWGILIHGLASSVVGFAVYALICRLLKLDEMIHLQSSLKRRWLKMFNVPAGIDEAESL